MWRQADVGPCRRRDQWPASHQGSADAAFQRRPRLGLIGGIACDCLLVSGGWSPMRLHLASQAGERPVWSDDLQTFLPPKRTEEWVGAGGMSGAMSTAAAISSGLAAGLVAAGGKPGKAAAAPAVQGFEADPRPAPVLEIKAKGKAFVDFQHDVTTDDVRLARTEGFVSVEHLKRYTTLGMATDQGKTSNARPGHHGSRAWKGYSRGRHDALPSALRARLDRFAGGGAPWRHFPGTPDANA
jgi:hypothetical protein